MLSRKVFALALAPLLGFALMFGLVGLSGLRSLVPPAQASLLVSGTPNGLPSTGVMDVPSCTSYLAGVAVGLSNAAATSACQNIAAAAPAGTSFGSFFDCVQGFIIAGSGGNAALGDCGGPGSSNASTSAGPSGAAGPSPSGSPSSTGGPSPRPSPSPATTTSACGQWNISGTWQLTQSNGYGATLTLQQSGTAITGTLTLSPSDQARGNYVSNSATVTGTLVGDQVQLMASPMQKHDGTASQAKYTGTIVPGQLINGQVQDLLHPGSMAGLTGTGPTACAGS